MNEINIDEICAWARASGDTARKYFNRITGERKPDRSWVTQADIEIEQFLRAQISDRYPDHGIMGEEQGIGSIDREFVWSLDPLDGTAAFLAGLSTWCVSIGLLRWGEPCLGVIYLPMLDDCYWTDGNDAAYRNDSIIHVNDTTVIDNNDWISVSSNAHRNFRISFPGKTRSLGSVAADFCYVARGSSLGALIGRASLWDIAAGLSILRAAGGVAVTLSGKPVDTKPLLGGLTHSEAILVSTPVLIEQLQEYIQRVER
jgi:myo-inositol-1(or 4)-monophosphatase